MFGNAVPDLHCAGEGHWPEQAEVVSPALAPKVPAGHAVQKDAPSSE